MEPTRAASEFEGGSPNCVRTQLDHFQNITMETHNEKVGIQSRNIRRCQSWTDVDDHQVSGPVTWVSNMSDHMGQTHGSVTSAGHMGQ